MDDKGIGSPDEGARIARVALIVSVVALAIAILGLFLPIR